MVEFLWTKALLGLKTPQRIGRTLSNTENKSKLRVQHQVTLAMIIYLNVSFRHKCA